MTQTIVRKSATQARGRARRKALLAAARDMLTTKTLQEIELSDVAAMAGIPKSSAYHFYSDIHSLYAELASIEDEELREVFLQPVPEAESWVEILFVLIDRAAAYFRANRSAQQLMLGPATPPDIKRSSRMADVAHGAVYEQQINAQFVLPDIPDRDRKFFCAVESIDLMFQLSLIERDVLDDAFVEEAKTIASAYLGAFIPRVLAKRSLTSTPEQVA